MSGLLPLTIPSVIAGLITGLLVALALLTLAGEIRGVQRARK
jgi:hypothetical protein